MANNKEVNAMRNNAATERSASLGIVMPCYNLGPYIKTALDSLMRQTYKDYTVYIVDDASTDTETTVYLQQLATELPSNFLIDFQTKNRGMHKVTNYAAKKLSTKYLFIFSPDDELQETYLEETVGYLEENPKTAAVCTWLEYFGEDKGIKKYSQESSSLPNMLVQNGFSGSAVMRKHIWDISGGYDEHPSQKVHEDYNLWLGFLSKGYTLGVISKPLFRYRIRGNSLSHSVEPAAEIAWMEHLTSKYSELFEKYSSTVIPSIWREAIAKRASYKEAMKGHEWLDREYHKQLYALDHLRADYRALEDRLTTIESSRLYRLVKIIKRLLAPLMRKIRQA